MNTSLTSTRRATALTTSAKIEKNTVDELHDTVQVKKKKKSNGTHERSLGEKTDGTGMRHEKRESH